MDLSTSRFLECKHWYIVKLWIRYSKGKGVYWGDNFSQFCIFQLKLQSQQAYHCKRRWYQGLHCWLIHVHWTWFKQAGWFNLINFEMHYFYCVSRWSCFNLCWPMITQNSIRNDCFFYLKINQINTVRSVLHIVIGLFYREINN